MIIYNKDAIIVVGVFDCFAYQMKLPNAWYRSVYTINAVFLFTISCMLSCLCKFHVRSKANWELNAKVEGTQLNDHENDSLGATDIEK